MKALNHNRNRLRRRNRLAAAWMTSLAAALVVCFFAIVLLLIVVVFDGLFVAAVGGGAQQGATSEWLSAASGGGLRKFSQHSHIAFLSGSSHNTLFRLGIVGSLSRQNNQPVAELTLTNNSAQPLSGFAIQFNKNTCVASIIRSRD
jgi:hypothetical protein